MSKARPLHFPVRNSVSTAAAFRRLGMAGVLFAFPLVSVAATYVYSPTSSTGDLWTAGTHWSLVPVSNLDTTLSFAPAANSVITNTSTNNSGSAFILNSLLLQGTGSASTGFPVAITINGGSL